MKEVGELIIDFLEEEQLNFCSEGDFQASLYKYLSLKHNLTIKAEHYINKYKIDLVLGNNPSNESGRFKLEDIRYLIELKYNRKCTQARSTNYVKKGFYKDLKKISSIVKNNNYMIGYVIVLSDNKNCWKSYDNEEPNLQKCFQTLSDTHIKDLSKNINLKDFKDKISYSYLLNKNGWQEVNKNNFKVLIIKIQNL